MLQKHDVRFWTRFSWLRMAEDSVAYCCEHCNESSDLNVLTGLVTFKLLKIYFVRRSLGEIQPPCKVRVRNTPLYVHSVSSETAKGSVFDS